MSSSIYSTTNRAVDEYVAKLGHPLASVRSRALQNITNKLSHHLVSIQDLSSNEALIHHLIEWFNKEECPHSKTVLTLLEQLSDIPHSARILNERGAILFFRTMSAFVPEVLLPHIEHIIDNLENAKLEYEKLINGGGSGSSKSDPSTGNQSTVLFNNMKNDVSYERDKAVSKTEQLMPSVVSPHTRTLIGDPINQTALSPQDEQYLFELNIKLRHRNVIVVLETIEELTLMVLDDFPSDVFFTNNDILKSLTSLLFIGNHSHSVLISSLKCIGLLFRKSWSFISNDPSQAYALIPTCNQQKLSFIVRHIFTHTLPLVEQRETSTEAVRTLRSIAPFIRFSCRELSDIKIVGDEQATIFSRLMSFVRANLNQLIVDLQYMSILSLLLDCMEQLADELLVYIPRELVSIFHDLLQNYKIRDRLEHLYDKILRQFFRFDPNRGKAFRDGDYEYEGTVPLQNPINLYDFTIQEMKSLSECMNEKQFVQTMVNLECLDFQNADVMTQLGKGDWLLYFNRFLVTKPENDLDCAILGRILTFIRRSIDAVKPSELGTLSKILEPSIVPILRERKDFKEYYSLQFKIVLLIECIIEKLKTNAQLLEILEKSICKLDVIHAILTLTESSNHEVIKRKAFRIMILYLMHYGRTISTEELSSMSVSVFGPIESLSVRNSFQNRRIIDECIIALCSHSSVMYSRGVSWIGPISFTWLKNLLEGQWISSIPKSSAFFLLSNSIPTVDDFRLLNESIPNVTDLCVQVAIDKSEDGRTRENALSFICSITHLLSNDTDIIPEMTNDNDLSQSIPALLKLIGKDHIKQVLSCLTESQVSHGFVACVSTIIYNLTSLGPESCSFLFELSVWSSLEVHINRMLHASGTRNESQLIDIITNVCDSVVSLLTEEPTLVNYFVERTSIVDLVFRVMSAISTGHESPVHSLALKLLVSCLAGPKTIWSDILDSPLQGDLYGSLLCENIASSYQVTSKNKVACTQDKKVFKEMSTMCASWIALLSVSQSAKKRFVDLDCCTMIFPLLDSILKLVSLNAKEKSKVAGDVISHSLGLLQSHIAVLQCFVHESEPSKEYISKYEIFNLLHRVWNLSIVTESLKQDSLSLIMNLLANSYPMKKAAISYNNSRTRNNIIATSIDALVDTKTNIKTLFLSSRIVASLTTHPSTCSLILKSNMLGGFKKCLDKLWTSRSLYRLEMLLFVLVGISFSDEGQQAIIQTKGLTETLLNLSGVLQLESKKQEDKWEQQELQICHHWLTVLRNLTFQKSNNVVTLTSEDLIGKLVTVLKSKRHLRNTKAYSVLVLHSATYHNQKCRNMISKPIIRDVLEQFLLEVDIDYTSPNYQSHASLTSIDLLNSLYDLITAKSSSEHEKSTNPFKDNFPL